MQIQRVLRFAEFLDSVERDIGVVADVGNIMLLMKKQKDFSRW